MFIKTRWFSGLLFAASTISHGQGTPCQRPPARSVAQGATVAIAGTTRPPCRLVFVDTPVELRADEGGLVGGITAVVRGPDGRFYTAFRSEVTVWSSEGRVLRRLGGRGAGPGEFMSMPTLYVDRENRLYALEAARWSVFAPNGDLIRTIALQQGRGSGSVLLPGRQYDTDVSTLLDDGTFLGADNSVQRSGFSFHLWDVGVAARSGNTDAPPAERFPLIRMFDSVPPSERDVASGRAIGYGGGNTFWAGAPWGTTTRGYELQLWRTDGTLLRSLKREVAWLPVAPQRPRPGRGATPERPPPIIGGILVDSSGLIYVMGTRPNDNWGKPPAPPRAPGTQPPSLPNSTSMIDVFIDVIDPNAGVVLASDGPLSLAEVVRRYSTVIFRGTRLGYRLGETSEGYPFARVVELRLVAQ